MSSKYILSSLMVLDLQKKSSKSQMVIMAKREKFILNASNENS